MIPATEVSIRSPRWENLEFDPAALAQDVIPQVWNEALHPPVLKGKEIEIGLVLADDETVRALNRDYRGKDKPTNVLSFAALDDAEEIPGDFFPLGDIVMAFETIEKEAAAMEIGFRDHYLHLVVHGALHLLGYDHEDDAEAAEMEGLEIKILAKLGVASPYNTEDFMA